MTEQQYEGDDWPREGNINDQTKQYNGEQPDPVEGNDDEDDTTEGDPE